MFLETDICIYHRNGFAYYTFLYISSDNSLGALEIWIELDEFQDTYTENQAQVQRSRQHNGTMQNAGIKFQELFLRLGAYPHIHRLSPHFNPDLLEIKVSQTLVLSDTIL
jgi:hypothetical protein